jgi:hypothetical protein
MDRARANSGVDKDRPSIITRILSENKRAGPRAETTQDLPSGRSTVRPGTHWRFRNRGCAGAPDILSGQDENGGRSLGEFLGLSADRGDLDAEQLIDTHLGEVVGTSANRTRGGICPAGLEALNPLPSAPGARFSALTAARSMNGAPPRYPG